MKALLLFLWDIIKYPLLIIFLLILIFRLLVVIYTFIESKKQKIKIKHRTVRKKKQRFFKSLVYTLPHQMALDRLQYDPDDFTYKGIVIFEGPQGNGKSISMAQFAETMLNEFPQAKCISNIKYTRADKALTHYKQLMTYNNGKHGVVVVIDELQNWFSCKDSKDFPPEMLSVVTQNRKNHRIILGTAQSFYMLAKDIRTQCTEVRSCKTFFGCLTIVRKKIPKIDSSGEVIDWKSNGWYWFIHSNDLRNSYDTYEVVQRMAKSGFYQRQVTPENKTNISVNVMQRKRGK